VIVVLVLSGCTSTQGAPRVSLSAPAEAPEIPLLNNASWPDMARAIARIEVMIENSSASKQLGDGFQFEGYQGSAAHELSRGFLLSATWTATIAFDILHRGEMAARNESVADVQSQSDHLETDILSRLGSHESDLCGVSAAFLAAWSRTSNEYVHSMTEENATLDQIELSASYRWSLLHVAGLLLNETECEPTTLHPGVRTWAEGLIQHDAPLLSRDLPGVEAREAVQMWQWAVDQHFDHAAEFLAIRAAAVSEQSRVYGEGNKGPSLQSVAELANSSFSRHPGGLSALSYAAGAKAYYDARDSQSQGIPDAIGASKAAVFFAAASAEPDKTYSALLASTPP
ncbi:MAG TPA: hypothetical protein VM370_03230, partial [Candidatus Thermoplasmatota archaeon]|nr:hypothetical protein [Candidatus Thermoplasmatota archaeon]